MKVGFLVLRFFLFASLFLELPRTFKGRFKPPPSHREIPFHAEWETPAPTEDVQKILSQPFTYLGRGSQMSVFLSEDRQFVLKFFRYETTLFPFLLQVKNWMRSHPKSDFKTKTEKTFRSVFFAATEAAPFTQVVYAHLNLTQNQLPVARLKAGKPFRLSLDNHRFFFQRRATPFKIALYEEAHTPEEITQRLTSLLSLVAERNALSIGNSDRALSSNFGFLGSEAVELDCGNYVKVPFSLQRQKEELEHYERAIERSLTKYSPSLLPIWKELRRKQEIAYDSIKNEASERLYRPAGTLY